MLEIITTVLLILFIYVIKYFFGAISISLLIKIPFIIILFLGAFNIYVTLLYGHKLSFWVVSFLSYANLLLIYFFFSTIFIQIVRLFFFKDSQVLYYLFLILLPLISIYAVYNAYKFPVVNKINIKEEFPKDFKELKLVFLTDLHVTRYTKQEKIRKIVDEVNKINPDFVLIAGDNVDDSVSNLSGVLKELGNFTSPTYMVFGNHEYYHGSGEWKKFFESLENIKLIENKCSFLENEKYKFHLCGMDFGPHYDEEHVNKNFFEILDMEDNQEYPKILLTHFPKVFKEAKKHNILLQLSGHTHGGMTFPISFITKLANGGYVRGLYKENSSYLYVSPGTSLWSGMPARIGNKNEITIVTVENN